MGEEDGSYASQSSLSKYQKCLPAHLTPLLAAVAAGNTTIANDLHCAGAPEVSMTPTTASLADAFCLHDFTDCARHIAAGADVNTKLQNGQGIRSTREGVPLHACCAQHQRPGAYELAQILISAGADLNAGDWEGDTPLAHAKYFRATQPGNDISALLSGSGAEVSGPYFRMFGRNV